MTSGPVQYQKNAGSIWLSRRNNGMSECYLAVCFPGLSRVLCWLSSVFLPQILIFPGIVSWALFFPHFTFSNTFLCSSYFRDSTTVRLKHGYIFPAACMIFHLGLLQKSLRLDIPKVSINVYSWKPLPLLVFLLRAPSFLVTLVGNLSTIPTSTPQSPVFTQLFV